MRPYFKLITAQGIQVGDLFWVSYYESPEQVRVVEAPGTDNLGPDTCVVEFLKNPNHRTLAGSRSLFSSEQEVLQKQREWRLVGSRDCPSSPDGVCHYGTIKGMVKLKDGSLVHPPQDWQGEQYENKDDCLFCHQPEERK